MRHAESLGNIGVSYEPEYQKDDPPLSESGLIQARMLADSSCIKNVGRIYSSTLVRTVQTAYPTAEKLHRNIILLSDLMEIGTTIAGTEKERLENFFPLAIPCLSEPTPSGGKLLLGDEGPTDMKMRAERLIEYFYSQAENGETLMIVTHGSFFGYLLRASLGIELPESFCWQVDNCSVTKVIFRKNQIPKLSFSNYTGHLD